MRRNRADCGRLELRLQPEDKAVLARAAALERLDLTSFILRPALRRAKATIVEAETLKLSKGESLRVLDLLKNPPAPPKRLVQTARAGFILGHE